MKLHYTYEMGATMMVYDIDELMHKESTNMQLNHCFPTQQEADYFRGYALMHGIAAKAYTKKDLPRSVKSMQMTLWATIPDLKLDLHCDSR